MDTSEINKKFIIFWSNTVATLFTLGFYFHYEIYLFRYKLLFINYKLYQESVWKADSATGLLIAWFLVNSDLFETSEGSTAISPKIKLWSYSLNNPK